MEVWVLFNQESSGVFDSKEKALASMMTFVSRFLGATYRYVDGGETWFMYEVSHGDYTFRVTGQEFILNEDNG